MSSNRPEVRLAKRTNQSANDTFATSSALANLSAIPSQAESSVRLYLGSGYRLGWVCQKPQRRPEGR